MLELYCLLFIEPETSDEVKAAENRRVTIWTNLVAFERSKHRLVEYAEMGRFYLQSDVGQRPTKFTKHGLSYFWRRATHAWKDGWLLNPLRDEPSQSMTSDKGGFSVDEGVRGEVEKLTSMPMHAIHDNKDGWWK